MRIELPERVPSWNTFYGGTSHWQRTAMKNLWRALMHTALPLDVVLLDKPVHITIYAEYKGTPVDVDNVCAKLLIDGLKGKLLHDDHPLWVSGVTCHSGNSKRNWVTVDIVEVE